MSCTNSHATAAVRSLTTIWPTALSASPALRRTLAGPDREHCRKEVRPAPNPVGAVLAQFSRREGCHLVSRRAPLSFTVCFPPHLLQHRISRSCNPGIFLEP